MALPKNYLSREKKWRQLSLLDVLTLLYNIHMGAKDESIGFEDARETLASMTHRLARRKTWVDPSVFESALWSCNLMNEKSAFFDAKGRTFEEFLRQVLKGDKFDLFYNTVEDKK